MLDLEEINVLPKETRQRYMLMEKLFEHPGFAYLIKWANHNAEEQKVRALTAQTWEQTLFARGAMQAFINFANLEEISEAEFKGVVDSIRNAGSAEAELDTDNE